MNDRHSNQSAGDVLLVDDDLPSLRVLTDLLLANGYQVRSARDGSTALMLALADPPELICLDVNMPEMDGFEVCRQLKCTPETADIPVIFVSARTEVVDKLQGFEVGGADYISKPYNLKEVDARFRTHLALYRLRKELDRRNEELLQEVQKRREAQTALEASRARLRAQYDGIPVPTYTWQRQGDDAVLVDYNTAAVAITQNKVSDSLGASATEVYKDRPDIIEDLSRCLVKKRSFEREMEYTFLSTGETKHLVVKYAFVSPDLVLVHTEDITARVQAEEAVKASQQFLQSSLDALSAHIAIINGRGIILAVNRSWRQFADENGLAWRDYGVGRNYLDAIDVAAGLTEPLAVKAANGIREVMDGQSDEFRLEYPCHSREENRWFVLRATRFESHEGIRVVLSHENITERRQAADALHKRTGELGERVRELSAVSTIARVVASTAELPEVLTTAAETITDLFQARATFITVPHGGDSRLEILAGFERNRGSLTEANLILPLSEMPITRQVLSSGEGRSILDLGSAPLPDSAQALVDDFGIRLVLLLPLKFRGEVTGVLILGHDESERSFNAAEISLAETIAADIAAAIETARFAEEARLAAVDAERQRLARELHDSVTQSLYSLVLLGSGWRNMARQGNLQNPAASFDQLVDVAQQALKDMRLLLHQLRPSMLEKEGLEKALRQRLESVEGRANIEARLITQGDLRSLPRDLEEQLFHIAQEALNNSLRHAQASEVIVQIAVDGSHVTLLIEDDGHGFDPHVATNGMGLQNMRERAESRNGSLTISSRPGEGCTIQVSAPF